MFCSASGRPAGEDVLDEGPSKHLLAGGMLPDVHLRPAEQLISGATDSRHCYHPSRATNERALRMPVGQARPFQDFQDLRGAEVAGEVAPERPTRGCFHGVGMGDHGAVDYARGAHEPAQRLVII